MGLERRQKINTLKNESLTITDITTINDLIDSTINDLEACDLPDDYCEARQKKLLKLRQKVSNLL